MNHPWEVGTAVSPYLPISLSLWPACLVYGAGTCCDCGVIHSSNTAANSWKRGWKSPSIFYTYFFTKNCIGTAENTQFIFINHSLMPSEFQRISQPSWILGDRDKPPEHWGILMLSFWNRRCVIVFGVLGKPRLTPICRVPCHFTVVWLLFPL